MKTLTSNQVSKSENSYKSNGWYQRSQSQLKANPELAQRLERNLDSGGTTRTPVWFAEAIRTI